MQETQFPDISVPKGTIKINSAVNVDLSLYNEQLKNIHHSEDQLKIK